MEFVGRTGEMRELSRPGDPYFIFLWGRRRIGKTSLALNAFNDHLYFFVGKKSSALLLKEFSEVVRRDHKFVPTFGNWDEFFIYLFNEYDGTIIIDEFQNFHFSDPSVFSTLQKIIDGSKSYKLVVVGSYVGMMKRIFIDSKEPLFGRSTGNLKVGPLPFPTICSILDRIGIVNLQEQISVFSIFGGVPYHYVLMERHGVRSFKDCLEKLVFSQLAPLRTEAKSVLIEEFGRNYSTYFSILQAIASGKNTVSDISNITGILIQSMGKYLQELTEVFDILERIVPFGGGKRGIYHIKDPFTRFWFRYVESYMSNIESGEVDYPLERVVNDRAMISSLGFENIVKELLGPGFTRTGKWWNRKGDEIDVIASDEKNKSILFGEVKWTNRKVGEKEIATLRSRAEMVRCPKGYEKKYLLVSRSGFNEISSYEDVTLWDLDDIRGNIREWNNDHDKIDDRPA